MQGVDELIFSRRKRISVAVQPGGRVVLRAPIGTSQATLEGFLRQHARWLEQARQKMAKVPVPAEPYKYAEGEPLVYMGQKLPLRFAAGLKKARLVQGEAIMLPKGGKRESRERLTAFYREETRRIVTGLVQVWAQRVGVQPSAIRVNSAKTRWGSCSVKGSLNFSLRLAMLPVAMIEYVVVHELAHMRQHNHSRAFWALVGHLLPDYASRRDWLKRNGSLLPPL